MENAVQEAFWSGIGSMLSNAWPILALLLVLNLAKPLFKQKRSKSSKHRKPLGFFEFITSAVGSGNATENTKARNESGEMFRAGDVLPDFLAEPKKSERNYSEDLMDQGDAYVARTHLMSPTERNVYKSLEKGYGEKYYIFCQVRVVDLIQPNFKKHHSNSREYLSLFRQLSQWHFDYVLCDKGDFRIFCALELDDSSHERESRAKRDRILNSACAAAGIKLHRLKLDHVKKVVSVYKEGEAP